MIHGPGVVVLRLEVDAECFPSFASERHNRTFHSPSDLVERIPYARCLQCQTCVIFSFVGAVEVRPERSSLSTDIHPFLKRLSW